LDLPQRLGFFFNLSASFLKVPFPSGVDPVVAAATIDDYPLLFLKIEFESFN